VRALSTEMHGDSLKYAKPATGRPPLDDGCGVVLLCIHNVQPVLGRQGCASTCLLTRSQKPVGVIQKLYILLLVRYAVRAIMADAAGLAGTAPTRLSVIHRRGVDLRHH
jgi:hypothetical protein